MDIRFLVVKVVPLFQSCTEITTIQEWFNHANAWFRSATLLLRKLKALV